MTEQTPETTEASEATEQPAPLEVEVNLTMPTDLLAEARARVASSCMRLSTGERVEYLVAPTVVPGDQGQPIPMLALTLAIPALTMGERIHWTSMIPNLWTSQEQFDSIVGQALAALLNGRSQQASSLS